jgi:FKBP-type peptidyl-prolyl cis-trans isomerase (trigger factor)
MTTACQHLPKSTVVLTLTIPWSEVKKIYESIVDEAVKKIEVSGFRKGKAPKKLATKKLDKTKVRQEVIGQVLPAAYAEAVREHSLKPIITPKVEIVKIDEENDWVFKATTAEKPTVNLGDYKTKVKKARVPETKIWTPKSKEKPKKEEKKPNTLSRVLDVLDKTCEVELPELLLENEVNRMLAQTLDEIKKLGITLDSYLVSTGKTIETLKKEYRDQARKTLKLEFILAEIAEKEKIVVGNQEIEEFVKKAPDEKTRKSLSGQKYYLASLLRKQKTLDHLLSL